ncbi:MAG: tetratricopeptide repeat protein [Parvicellaceae bacterium]
MKKNNDIFNTENHLSKQEIKKFLKGDINEKDASVIESKIQSNDFYAEAIEGFKNNPNGIDQLENLDKRIDSRISKTFFSLNGLLLAATIVLLVTSTSIIFYSLSASKTIAEQPAEKPIQKQTAIIKELTDSAIDVAQTLPKKELISATQIIINSPVKIQNNEDIQSEKIEKRTNEVIKMKLREAVKINVPANNYKVPLSVINTPYMYLHQLLVYSYKDRADIKKEVLKAPLTGLPASYESTPSNELQTPTYTKEISYNNFLKNALLLFRENKFKGALKEFKVILNKYPKDINALFYGGLCYYNINKQEKAVAHFQACLTHPFSIFEEEARWYKAKALYEKKEFNSAKLCLEEIILKNGFYSKSAKKLLLKINS